MSEWRTVLVSPLFSCYSLLSIPPSFSPLFSLILFYPLNSSISLLSTPPSLYSPPLHLSPLHSSISSPSPYFFPALFFPGSLPAMVPLLVHWLVLCCSVLCCGSVDAGTYSASLVTHLSGTQASSAAGRGLCVWNLSIT